MEDGTAAYPGGSDVRHDASHRRKTVSGALQHVRDTEHGDQPTPLEDMKFPWSSPSAPSSPVTATTPSPQKPSHRRSFSGNILQKLNVFRSSPTKEKEDGNGRPASRDKEPPKSPISWKSRKSIDDDTPITSPTSPNGDATAVPFVLRPVIKPRKRKGSLRKTALLGGRRFLGAEGRERKNSLGAKSPLSKVPLQQQQQHQHQQTSHPARAPSTDVFVDDDEDGDADSLTAQPHSETENGMPRRQFSYENVVAPSSTDSGWSEPSAAVSAARLSLVTEHQAHVQQTAKASIHELGSPLDLKSPISQSQASYASTTDDDDILTFNRPSAKNFLDSNISLLAPPKPLSATSTSYFPSTTSLSLSRNRAGSQHQRSPLSHTISSSSLVPSEPHDYTETAYWGYIILLLTWVTFTVGMGSVLGIWSWAWDVGETPYAPPELEDDPTLPIVGYYPALIVLTGVVGWVWVTVAWVGMKYFKHAGVAEV